ncbi:GNAT family N-acetyltransferase [Streptomyces erythrochromogenes]|uniref:GNAT family N-acetyltransferase n=1 Tax=Streptomyces erythrochromogenes TaxID=285574 RepID=UPI0036885DC1
MAPQLRTLETGEWDTWYRTLERAFGGPPTPPEARELWQSLTEHDRSLGAWEGAGDGDECVGTAGAFSLRLSVPGSAAVDTAGVTMVSVAATHRRRGLLTTMMRRQLDDIRGRGEPLAALVASEPGIYGRFGYGMATQQLSATVDTARVRLEVPAGTGADAVRLRYADPVSALPACEAVYAEAVAERPGMPARRPGWDRVAVLAPQGGRDGGSPLLCVVAERDGVTVGYARFHNTPQWDVSGARGTIVLRDLEARDPGAYASLWRFLFEIDLTSTLVAQNRPVDDAWQHLVSDVRRCERQLRDGLFVRLVDVGTALESRTYRTEVDVVLEVEDPFCPWNEGRWRLSGDHRGASCTRTAAPADVALPVGALASAYLGGVPLTALARAGRAGELGRGTLARASLAFGNETAPWLPHSF